MNLFFSSILCEPFETSTSIDFQVREPEQQLVFNVKTTGAPRPRVLRDHGCSESGSAESYSCCCSPLKRTEERQKRQRDSILVAGLLSQLPVIETRPGPGQV